MGLISMALTYNKSKRDFIKDRQNRKENLNVAKSIFTCSDSELGITIDSNGEPKSATISKDFAELAYFSNTYSKYISIDSSFAEPLIKADQKLSGLKQKVEASQNRYASIMANQPKFSDLRAKFKVAEAKKYSVSPMKYALSIFGIGDNTAGEIRQSKLEAESAYIKEAFAHKKEIYTLTEEFNEEKKEVMKKVKENLQSYHSTMQNKLQVAKEYVAIQELLKKQNVKTALMASNQTLATKIENMPYPLVIHDSKEPLPELPTLAEIKTALINAQRNDYIQELDDSLTKIDNGLIDYTTNKRTTTQYAIEAAKKAGEKAREKDARSTPREDASEKYKAAKKLEATAETKKEELKKENINLINELEALQERAKAKDENGNAIPLSQKDLLRLNTLQSVIRNIFSEVNQELKNATALVEKYKTGNEENTQEQENKEDQNNPENTPTPNDGREDPDDGERS